MANLKKLAEIFEACAKEARIGVAEVSDGRSGHVDDNEEEVLEEATTAQKEGQDLTAEVEEGGFGAPDEVSTGELATYAITEQDKDDFAPDVKDAALKITGTPAQPKSEEQAEAGNYRKGHAKMHGLSIAIENAKGQTRSGTGADGKTWTSKMYAHYGYIKRTLSKADGDHIDVFIGPDEKSEIVFVVNQNNHGKKTFDEHKCMLGYSNEEAARKGYLANYEKGWDGVGSITPMTIAQFKWWIRHGDTSKPAKAIVKKAGIPMSRIMKAIGLPALGAGGLLGGAAYHQSQPYKGDPEASRWSVHMTRRTLNKALEQLQRGSADVDVATGRHRKAIPLSRINEAALKHLNYTPTAVAIPERGQQQLITHRRRPDAKRPHFNPHVHKHKKNWFVHIDKDPALTLALEEAKDWPSRMKALTRGMKHIFHEGIPGGMLYLKNMMQNKPTFEDFMKMPRNQRRMEFSEPGESSLLSDPHKHASSPLRPGNTTIMMQVVSGDEKRAELLVEVAETQANAAKGLSFVPEMPSGYGMLFKTAKSFWMRGVNFDLDMVFMDKTGQVLEIQRMKAPKQGHLPMNTYQPTVKQATLSLEVPAGWCEHYSVKPGDQLTVVA